jgi:hypothetical protein
MKKIVSVIGLAALLAGCASNNGGMGGTYSDEHAFHNNATNGTGSSTTAPNDATFGGGGKTEPNNG